MRFCVLAALIAVNLSNAGAAAYSVQDPAADHAAVAIEFAEGGDMTRAIASFRAAAKFAPGTAEHWFNLGTALEDEDFDEKTAATAAEAKKAFRRHSALQGGGSADSGGGGEGDELQGGGAIPGRGWGLDWTIDVSDKHKRYTSDGIQRAQAGDIEGALQYFSAQRMFKPQGTTFANCGISLADFGIKQLGDGEEKKAIETFCEADAAFRMAALLKANSEGHARVEHYLKNKGKGSRHACHSKRRDILLRALAHHQSGGMEGHMQAVKMICGDVRSLTVALTEGEKRRGLASATTSLELWILMRVCGVVAISDVFPTAFMDSLKAQLDIDFDADQKVLAEAKAKRRYKEKTNPHRKESWEAEEAASRAQDRFEIKLAMKEPYTNADLTQNSHVLTFAKTLLTDDLELDTFSYVTSLAGAPHMHWHNDVGGLFKHETGLEKHSPPQGLVLVVPAVDMNALNGPTEFMCGSHVQKSELGGGDWWHRFDDPNTPGSPPHAAIPATRGSVVIFDVRLRHRGTANRSKQRRSILYLGYMRGWYRDIVNFKDKHTKEWAERDQTHRKLFSRLDSQKYTKKLEEMLTERGVDLATVQSTLNFKQVELAA